MASLEIRQNPLSMEEIQTWSMAELGTNSSPASQLTHRMPVPLGGIVPRSLFLIPAIDVSGSAPDKTTELFLFLDPLESHDHEIESRAHRNRETVASYKHRIKVLKEQAELDGYSLNVPSEAAFLEFVEKNPLIRRGRLVLMENGNLRAVWKDDNGAHLGLQFVDSRTVQYVIFKQRQPSAPVSRVTGRDTMEGISRQIAAFDLDSALYR